MKYKGGGIQIKIKPIISLLSIMRHQLHNSVPVGIPIAMYNDSMYFRLIKTFIRSNNTCANRLVGAGRESNDKL